MTRTLKNITKEEIEEAVANTDSSSAACRRLNINSSGGSASRLKEVAIKLGIDTSHWLGQAWSRSKIHLDDVRVKTYTDGEVFTENSKASSAWIRKAILKKNLIEYKCHCGVSDTWNGNKLSLQLDHINGNRKDHRLENLRWLCPNCHSQTETFCSKNRKDKGNISDAALVESLKKSQNIRQALVNLDMAIGGNYKRAKKLIKKHNIIFQE